MQPTATATWRGDLKGVKGALSTPSARLSDPPCSFKRRFENAIGTNPEELPAAAHAGCFTMALPAQPGKAGLMTERLETTATITFEKVAEHFTITKNHLDRLAHVPGANQATCDAAVKAAETGCRVSKLFKARISVDARVEVTA